ncbi:flagellar hook capping FlgD N-terminal domain-containing protein [Spirillospora albida]|uniref:flagellar hook capping FlgD N-terminal domain-containing protein n=1 Tax=Spirillospora albida TaxID=58123 RepID=UPI0004BFC254|nr:flagellar hook capping FlgD N-terminal domain-containing protein [Spirillospora albida]
MTTPINGAASAATPAPAAKTSNPNQLGKDAFLKLLVAQMRYQDPSKPTDSAQFLSQTATFTQVERLEELAAAQTEMLAAQRMLSAGNLVGKTVSFTGPDGTEASGQVTSASFTGSTPTLRVGNTDVPLSSVKEIRTA